MFPTTRCFLSLSSGLEKWLENPLCFGKCNSKTPDKESFSHIAKSYNIDGEILEPDQKLYFSFRRVHGWGYMNVSEMLERMHKNDLFEYISRVF